MRIGILEADWLGKETQEKYGSYGDMFRILLSSVDEQLLFQTYQVTELEYPEHINECDAYLITGSKDSVYENKPWIMQLQKYITILSDHSKKLIGICFGHQLVAQALGGRVEKSERGWGIGLAQSAVVKTKPWMIPASEKFVLLVSHQDQVINLPQEAELIAESEFCPYASYQIGSHILCFQGHPEFTHDYVRHRMLARRQIIGEQRYQQGLASLDQNAEHELIARWILNFVNL